MEQFLDQKKAEFEAYGQKVAEAFAKKEEEESELRAKLDSAEGEYVAKLEEKQQEIGTLSDQINGLEGDLEQARRLHQEDSEALNGRIQEAQQRIEEMETRVADLSQELEAGRQE